MSDRLAAYRLFVRVARRGSFSLAAREVGVPQSTASRAIAVLEREIGASLLMRTTHAVTLTDAGADFLARIEHILADVDEAEHAARGTGELKGLLRVGLGTSLGLRVVIPRLKPFVDRHPALQVELLLDDQHQNLVTEGVDVALRLAAVLADSAATVRKLKTWPLLLAASATYLQHAPPLSTPADLAAHRVIIGPQGVRDWSFRKGGTATSVRVEGRLTVAAVEGALAAAMAGMGVVMATRGSIRQELEDGSLVQVLRDWDLGSVDLHALFTSGHAAKPSARAFVDYLHKTLRDA